MKLTFLIILKYILSIQLLKLLMVYLIMLQMTTEEGKVPVREYFVEKAPRKGQCEELNKVLSLWSSKVILQHFIIAIFFVPGAAGFSWLFMLCFKLLLLYWPLKIGRPLIPNIIPRSLSSSQYGAISWALLLQAQYLIKLME